MKVIFLDIDGVLNCANTKQRHRGFIGIDPYMALIFCRIPEATGAKVVISSSWRHFKGGLEEIEKQVCKFIDITPTLRGEIRGEEIEAWLKQHPEVEKYAILDDDSNFLPDQPLFKTEWKLGLTEEMVNRVIKYLNE